MKLVTFNIRLDWNRDGANNFCFRKNMILNKIRKEKPEIICFQEVLPHVALWLKENLTEYYIVGCPREVNFQGEQTCIAFLPGRFNLMKLDCYWLSPTPFVPGSRYEIQSDCPRVCTEATFHYLPANKVFRLTNTHLDHVGHPARILGVQQIAQKLKRESFFPDAPCIFVGDMNAEPDSEEMQLVTTMTGMVDLAAESGGTYHGFHTVQPVKIDYIFADPSIHCHGISKWDDEESGVFLSDHYPICAEIEL